LGFEDKSIRVRRKKYVRPLLLFSAKFNLTLPPTQSKHWWPQIVEMFASTAISAARLGMLQSRTARLSIPGLVSASRAGLFLAPRHFCKSHSAQRCAREPPCKEPAFQCLAGRTTQARNSCSSRSAQARTTSVKPTWLLPCSSLARSLADPLPHDLSCSQEKSSLGLPGSDVCSSACSFEEHP
jgi:hypothetical protein